MPATADPAAWIRRFHAAAGAGLSVVCLPHAGGSASYYFPFSQALAPEFEVLAVQYPGRQDRRAEPCLGTIAELADAVFAVLRGHVDRPVALFGHSMGATLGFEIARRLDRSGTPPVVLFASGRRAPSCDSDDGVHLLDDSELVRELRALDSTTGTLLADEELRAMILPAVRADYLAIESYLCHCDVRVSCPISVLVGDADPRTSLADAAAWSGHTTGAFTRHVLPGGHFFLAPCLHEVAALVVGTLRAIPMSHPARRG